MGEKMTTVQSVQVILYSVEADLYVRDVFCIFLHVRNAELVMCLTDANYV